MTIPDLWKDPLFSKKVLLVGGGVRDTLLGVTPKDHDWVIVGATQADVQILLNRGYVQVGADFPVFLHPQTGEEYALARVERKSGKGYHGFTVQADEHVTLEEDLVRRDLTINSMAMDENKVLTDPHHGLRDIKNRVLRHTSEAFAEDPLRVLRLARFAGRMPEWTIHTGTIELCKQISRSGALNELSVERIWVELEKGLNEQSALRFFEVLDQLEVMEHCRVLTRVFGPHLSERQRFLCKALNSLVQGDRYTIGVAVLALDVDLLKLGASRRVHDCASAVQFNITQPRTPENVLSLLKKIKAMHNNPTFYDVKFAAFVLRCADVKHMITARELDTARHAVLQVQAADFTEVGVALGKAIETKRLQELGLALQFEG
jgi:tRNA nucleotidyltransferase/poly(A) polymerase